MPRVWVNLSTVNWSFVDYSTTRGTVRIEVPPGVGIRLPKETISVDKTGHGMREGKTE